MTSFEVIEPLGLLEQSGLEAHGGGWDVDAVLGTQSRQHHELDIALPHDRAQRMRPFSIAAAVPVAPSSS